MNTTRRSFALLCASLFLALTTLVSAKEVDPKLLALEAQAISVINKVKDSVVAIQLLSPDGTVEGSGSGVIVSEDGYVFTAAHVVEGKKVAEAILSDGTHHKMEVLGMNRYRDSAICRLVEKGKKWNFTPIGNSDAAQVTDWVIAMGHGRGYDEDRSAPVRFGRIRAHNPGRFITSDCPLIAGDSGGPLFAMDGTVVAINSSINGLARFNVHAGVSGFKDDLDRMLKGEAWGQLLPNVLYTPETPLIGISFPNATTDQLRRVDPRPIVARLTPGGPADRAGLIPGDLLLSIDDEKLDTIMDVYIALGRKNPGKTVQVTFRRGNKVGKTEAVLIARGNVDPRSISAPQIKDTEDSPYLKDQDKPRLEKQITEIFDWVAPLAETHGETYIQLFERSAIYDREGNLTPLLQATIIDDQLALAPLSAYVDLPNDLVAWRPGIDAYPVKLTGGYLEHDLAVLNIPGLKASRKLFDHVKNAKLGEFLVAVGNSGNENSIIRLGVVSVEERDLGAKFGVGGNINQTGKGAIITFVQKGYAASRIGLKEGDLVTKFNGVPIKSFSALVTEIKKLRVGDEIKAEYSRNGKRFTASSAIGAQLSDGARIDMMDQLGRNSLSQNTSNFQTIIQSDILVEPEECGAPIFGVQGHFIGMAVSDAGRNKSYILSSEVISKALQEAPQKVENSNQASNKSLAQGSQGTRYRSQTPSEREQAEQNRRRRNEQLERFFQESDPATNDLDRLFEKLFGR